MSGAGAAQAFLNPHGFIHEVVTVRRVENVTLTGAPTTDFTWYPGYAWQIAWCVKCAAHVGWSFAAVGEAEPRGFWALRRDAIVEAGH